MKILLTTTSAGIDSPVDPRFGRAGHFLVVDPETLEWQVLPNPGATASGGAGVQAAQFAADKACDAVISGDFGPNAFNVLKEAGIAMYTYGSCRTVHEAIQRFMSGQMETLAVPTGSSRKGK
jgi:predicted Fe-Mo cluster-binding NifX family protein